MTAAPEEIAEGAPDLRLRAKPPPVARLSRRALMLMSGVGAAALIGAVTIGLSLQVRPGPPEPQFTVSTTPPERLNALPADYREVPRLGSPLPGDLGRPMLAAEAGRAPLEGSQAPRAETARQAEHDAAQRSQLFLPQGRGGDRPLGGLGSVAGHEPTAASSRPGDAGAPPVVQAGTLIAAALITGIQSDLPGQVVAQVTQPVFDSETGRTLLIPQGAKLVGTYDSKLAFGQSRVHVVWTRLLLPNARTVALGEFPAGDALGRAGVEGRVERHWGSLFAMAALSTLLAIGSEVGASDDDELVAAIRRGGADTFNQVGQQAVGRALAQAPTIQIRPGAPVRVIVTQDLELEPYQELPRWPNG
ncbi:TrbI/VirB10 family protein [Phenylobacterium sp. 58.2.17]|uniref:TrbI/VirB10 family protein n=1 Tax=Phenylobacterium sp. 58.2.17 TaxID=2969306 RepID=UPI0022655923|nr:TrbI/VirB10 family protein [Phenylobacterium sp. 58.2.17]MCX7586302.1 TrbI/VirB10 family protein [Phenylobacterium sp. 58.2.17]